MLAASAGTASSMAAGRMASWRGPSRSGTGCPTCPTRPRSWSWSGWASYADESSTITELKGALGLDHSEGCSFADWHHHVTLVVVAHGFRTLERLRRPRPVASAWLRGSCWASCKPCSSAGPALSASGPCHDGYAERGEHARQADKARL